MSKELEALERLKTAPSFMGGTAEYQACTQSEAALAQDYETVKQALLKAQFLEEEYNNLMEDKDNLESELFKVTAPKQYLKWEDLEFNHTPKMIDVKMNGNKYMLVVGYNVAGYNLAILRSDKQQYCFLEVDKQFFNDLHLERVEE